MKKIEEKDYLENLLNSTTGKKSEPASKQSQDLDDIVDNTYEVVDAKKIKRRPKRE